MTSTHCRHSGRLLAAAGLFAIVGAAQAGNGLNVTGSGAQSLGLGGADIAVTGSTTAVNINPANLTALDRPRLDASIEPFYTFGYGHSDNLNTQQDNDAAYGALLDVSYSQPFLRPDLRLGLGLFVAGGAGVLYENLNTAFGTTDEYGAIFGVTKFVTGLAWQVTPTVSVGGGVNVSFASIRQKIFPNTSNGAAGFYGLRLDSAEGFSVNGRVGITWQASDNLKLAASYATINKLKLDGGSITVNYSDAGLGLDRVRYGDARVTGFALPQEFGVGAAWQVAPRWLIAADVLWLDWSSALKTATLIANRPAESAAPATVRLAQALNFRDQVVLAVGVKYALNAKTELLAGFNIARNPIPNETITPSINATQELEFNAGIRRVLSSRWEIATALQYQPGKTEANRNVAQPFTGAREGYGVVALVFEVSRRW